MDRTPRPVVDVSAKCACGAVTLRFAGKVLSMFMCSCEDCQKATGTGHSAVALFASPDDVTIAGGQKLRAAGQFRRDLHPLVLPALRHADRGAIEPRRAPH